MLAPDQFPRTPDEVAIAPPASARLRVLGVHPFVAATLAPGAARESALAAWARRQLNLWVAAIALILLAPLFLAIALLVKLTSPGPVFYSQTRVGLDRRRGLQAHAGDGRRAVDFGGRLFTIYKFRTMHCAPPGEEHQVWASPNDPRITRVGQVLRAFRLDELPQLWNVLKGDMNVVGPRPEQPRIVVQIREHVPSYAIRQSVLPGITGWAQVNHSYDQSISDVHRKVELDIEYIQRASFLTDLRIMWRTLPVMFFRSGAL